jgi:hypothetical protein
MREYRRNTDQRKQPLEEYEWLRVTSFARLASARQNQCCQKEYTAPRSSGGGTSALGKTRRKMFFLQNQTQFSQR